MGTCTLLAPVPTPDLVALTLVSWFCFLFPKLIIFPTLGFSEVLTQASPYSFVCLCVSTWQYFWKQLSGKSIDFYSCYFSNNLDFFCLPSPCPLWFLLFPLIPSLLGHRGGVCKYHLNDELTPVPHNLIILWLVTKDLAKTLVALLCIPFILSVALQFSVLCYGCCMSLQMNVQHCWSSLLPFSCLALGSVGRSGTFHMKSLLTTDSNQTWLL